MDNMHNGEKRQTEKTEKTAREKIALKVAEYVVSGRVERDAATATSILVLLLRMRGLSASGNATVKAAIPEDTISDAVEETVRKVQDVTGHDRTIGPDGLFGKGYKAGETIFISGYKKGG